MIINGAVSKELYDKIEQFSFFCGISTCKMQDFLSENRHEEDIQLFIDIQGLEGLSEEILKVIYIHYPIIAAVETEEEKRCVLEKYGEYCELLLYPFNQYSFRKYLISKAREERTEEKSLYYGRLQINRRGREIRLDGKRVEVGYFDYEILLLLVEHMGQVISREEMNRCLPERKRTTQRNVDTHIKNIRKIFGKQDVIKCVRNVGYGISMENFYRILKL